MIKRRWRRCRRATAKHSTGLAVDLVALDYQILDGGQEQTPENQWLQENCGRYGFILRYPEGKEAVTDIHYESWHFRYVGVEAAQKIMSRGSTLEVSGSVLRRAMR
ncbi:MAG: M15 family metallopeptidase [Lachnospiraceae bacterium]